MWQAPPSPHFHNKRQSINNFFKNRENSIIEQLPSDLWSLTFLSVSQNSYLVTTATCGRLFCLLAQILKGNLTKKCSGSRLMSFYPEGNIQLSHSKPIVVQTVGHIWSMKLPELNGKGCVVCLLPALQCGIQNSRVHNMTLWYMMWWTFTWYPGKEGGHRTKETELHWQHKEKAKDWQQCHQIIMDQPVLPDRMGACAVRINVLMYMLCYVPTTIRNGAGLHQAQISTSLFKNQSS